MEPSGPQKGLRGHLTALRTAVSQMPRVVELIWEAYPTAAALVPIITIVQGTLPALNV